jgi:hypothetical protein
MAQGANDAGGHARIPEKAFPLTGIEQGVHAFGE